MPQITTTLTDRNNLQSLNKKNNILVTSTANLKPIPGMWQEPSNAQRAISKNNEFSDVKFQNDGQIKFRSHKSEYLSAPKIL